MAQHAHPTHVEPRVGDARRRRRRWRVIASAIVLVALGVLTRDLARTVPAGAREGGAAAAGGVDEGRLRVVGLNIHSAKGDDGEQDLDRTIAELSGADVAVLNEVRYAQGQHEAIANALRMTLLAAPTERRWGRDDFGNVILSRAAVESWEVLPMHNSGGRGWRNVTTAHLNVGGTTLTIIGTHLDRVDDRAAQLALVLDRFEAARPPVLLVGDLNTTGDDPRLAQTLARPDVDDVLGRLGGVEPTAHIDWLLLRDGGLIRATAAGLRETPASDHPVVWVDLSIATAAPATRPTATANYKWPPVAATLPGRGLSPAHSHRLVTW